VLRILSWLQPLGSGASTTKAAISCLKNSICLRDLSRCTTRKPCSWQGTNQGGNGSSAIVTASAMHAPLCVQVKQLIWVSRGPRRDSGTKSGSRQPSRGHSRRAGGEGGNATRLWYCQAMVLLYAMHLAKLLPLVSLCLAVVWVW
jgi:hypothetical protein